jgi:diguanylate cyclase (GGDEF)-like protein/PAS domain S-box-containing protein
MDIAKKPGAIAIRRPRSVLGAAISRLLARSPQRWGWLVFVLLTVTVSALALASVFCMDALSSARAYVGGESLWTKGQKAAVSHLIRYADSGDEEEWREYRLAISVPLGDRVAREELEKPRPDSAIARQGLLEGGNHPDDIPGMIRLFRWFRHVEFLDRAISIWAEGDALIAQLRQAADELHAAVLSGARRSAVQPALERVEWLDRRLTPLEVRFSETLGEASRKTRAALTAALLAAGSVLIAFAALFVRRLVQHAAGYEKALRKTNAQLADQNELLRVTLESIADAVITTDANGRVQWINAVASRLTGWPVSEATGRPIDQVFQIFYEDTRQAASSPIARALTEERTVGLTEPRALIGRDGTERAIQDSAAPIRDKDGRVLGIVLVFHDVTEQRRLAKEVTHRASHDALTGLVNRGEFEVRLHRAFASAQADNHAHALMYIDLDQFKLVNDACGHSAGDRLLREVASLLQGIVRTRDTLARLGGDEFGILLENCSVQQARRVAEQLCDRMERFRFVHEDRRFRVGASIGVVPVDAHWSSQAEIMQAADSACYAAKEAGRNRVHECTDANVESRRGEMQWVTRLENALDEQRFRLYGQRIVRCDGRESGMHLEVLLRLVETDGRLIAPAVFLPAAERFSLASRIDRWVLREVLDWMAAQDLDVIETVAVNLSGQSIGDRRFHRYVAEMISNATFDSKKLCFEITETAAITNMADAEEFIKAMRACGVRIALDDFGAGASSFGYLKTLPIDFLKIDGQFVRDIWKDRLDHTAVSCFRDVAAVCGLQTIAECVETQDVLAELRRIGIDLAQGYLMHSPEPLDALASSPRAHLTS